MKKSLFILAATVVALCACNKETKTADFQGTPCKLSVAVSGNITKADTIADTEDEAAVNSLQVFIFRNDELDAYGAVANATSIDISATTGERTIFAVVNAPDLSAISKLSTLQATVSALTDNSLTSYVMVGNKTQTLILDNSVTINVDRIAARIKVDKVTRNFTAEALADATFEIVRFYETNVVGNDTYGLTAPSTLVWYTLPGTAIQTGMPLLYNKLATAAALAQNEAYETPVALYCYPNATAADDYEYNEGVFVQANAGITRFVMEAKINGDFYTYPIQIAGIENNKSYEIRNLVITRLGNPSDGDDDNDPGEDDPIQSGDITFSVEVNDWGLVLLGTEGTVTI